MLLVMCRTIKNDITAAVEKLISTGKRKGVGLLFFSTLSSLVGQRPFLAMQIDRQTDRQTDRQPVLGHAMYLH
jgi:hypothetical protein